MTIQSPASPFYSPKAGGLPGGHTPGLSRTGLSNIPILVTAFLAILATGGPTYSFGVYAGTLKRTLHLTQSQLETLGAASFAAGFLSWIPGLAVDAWGSRLSLIVGGCGQSLGFALYWAVTRFHLVHDAYVIPVLSLLSVLIFTSNNMVIGGVFKAIVVSCGLGTKGKAVGAAKAYLGMGAGVFSSLFHALFHGSDLDFLVMSSAFAIFAIVFPAAIALPTNEQMALKGTKDDSNDRHYNQVYIGLFTVALVVVGSSAMALIPSHEHSTARIPQCLYGLVVLAVWIGPILSLLTLPTQSGSNRKDYQRQQSALRRKVRQQMERDLEELLHPPPPNEQMRLIPPPATTTTTATPATTMIVPESFTDTPHPDPIVSAVLETPQPIPDLTLLQMLQTLPAWLFLTASTVLVGSGTMLTINMGQIVQSHHYPSESAAAGLALFSVAQALARVLSGDVSESALQWSSIRLFGLRDGGVPRTAFLVLSSALAVLGHGLLAFYSSHLGLLVVGICLTGFSFGGLWPLMVLIVGDLFGTVNHGANYMFMDGFTCAVGTLSIAKFLTQSVYEKHVSEGVETCFGEACFRETHLVISGLCLGAVLACTILLYTTRSSYGPLA